MTRFLADLETMWPRGICKQSTSFYNIQNRLCPSQKSLESKKIQEILRNKTAISPKLIHLSITVLCNDGCAFSGGSEYFCILRKWRVQILQSRTLKANSIYYFHAKLVCNHLLRVSNIVKIIH